MRGWTFEEVEAWLARYERREVELTAESLEALVFGGHCRLTSLKYRDRRGKNWTGR